MKGELVFCEAEDDEELFELSPEDKVLLFDRNTEFSRIDQEKLDLFCETLTYMRSVAELRGNKLEWDFDEVTASGTMILTCDGTLGNEDVSKQAILSALKNMDSVEIRSQKEKLVVHCFVCFLV